MSCPSVARGRPHRACGESSRESIRQPRRMKFQTALRIPVDSLPPLLHLVGDARRLVRADRARNNARKCARLEGQKKPKEFAGLRRRAPCVARRFRTSRDGGKRYRRGVNSALGGLVRERTLLQRSGDGKMMSWWSPVRVLATSFY